MARVEKKPRAESTLSEERLQRALPRDAADPALRGEGRGALPRRRAAGLPARLHRPGGGRRGRLRRPRAGGRDRVDASRARPHDREGNARERGHGRALRQEGGLLARLRRLDAPLRRRARQSRRERGRRRRPAGDRRRRAGVPVPQGGAGRGRVLRRRLDQHRHVPRVAQPGAALEGARALRARDERLGRVDADLAARADRRTSRSAPTRSACARSTSTARTSRPCTRRPRRRASTRSRARGRSSSTSAPTASSATTSATRRSTATRRRSRSCATSKDPIELLRARLELSDDEFEALDTEVTGIVEASVEFAKAGTDPKPEDALKCVYA